MPTGVYVRTEEHKEKLRKTETGKPSPRYKEHYPKMSEARKGKHYSPNTEFKKGQMIGEKNPNWKGGVSFKDSENIKNRHSYEMQLWRKACLERDNFTCQICGQHGGSLVIHHIFNFAEFFDKRFAIDNGITLCKECHLKFHRIYGKKNNTKEQLEEFSKEE